MPELQSLLLSDCGVYADHHLGKWLKAQRLPVLASFEEVYLHSNIFFLLHWFIVSLSALKVLFVSSVLLVGSACLWRLRIRVAVLRLLSLDCSPEYSPTVPFGGLRSSSGCLPVLQRTHCRPSCESRRPRASLLAASVFCLYVL